MRTTPGTGAILLPIFDGDKYSVSKIEVIDGGSGYASTDPPKIEIENTATPTIEGVFHPIINHPSNGSIVSVLIVNPGEGYFPVTNTLGEKIGIGTTSLVESQFVTKEYGAGIIMGVSGGIGTTNPTSKLHVIGDARVGINTSQGVILTSANGTSYRLIVSNAGVLSTILVT